MVNLTLQFVRFHSSTRTVLQNIKLSEEGSYKNISSSLYFTTLPRNNSITRPGLRKVKLKPLGNVQKGPVIIKCKNENLNHYKGIQYKKLEVPKLASQGWMHQKSYGDYFTILPSEANPAFFLPENIENIPKEFEDFKINTKLVKQLIKEGFLFPTAIQSKAIPKILSGKDVLITADTGCGKTLAYTIPMLEHILQWKSKINQGLNSPLGLIILPTRELVMQVTEVIARLSGSFDINVKTLLADRTKRSLLALNEDSFENVDILVTTLGVICKYTFHKVYDLSNCIHLVIDEADTLLDDSFNEKLRVLFKRCKFRFSEIDPNGDEAPAGAHVTFVSATKPTDLDNIMDGIFPTGLLNIVSTSYLHKIQPHISQKFMRCRKSDKASIILSLVRKDLKHGIPVIIFCNKTDTCNWLARHLVENEIQCSRLNSQIKNEDRIQELLKFRAGEVNVMCCTNIGSRGLDIPRVKHVINYEFPKFMADYVHRCGRTGRINNDNNCMVTNLVSSKNEIHLVQKIETATRISKELPNVNNNLPRIIHYKIKNEAFK